MFGKFKRNLIITPHLCFNTRRFKIFEIKLETFPRIFDFSMLNRPFPSSKKSHFESEAKCEAIDVKMIFNNDANKTDFHGKGFALSLVLKVRFFGTRKWPITCMCLVPVG